MKRIRIKVTNKNSKKSMNCNQSYGTKFLRVCILRKIKERGKKSNDEEKTKSSDYHNNINNNNNNNNYSNNKKNNNSNKNYVLKIQQMTTTLREK